MRWNAVRNSKKPRAALIKSKKRSEEKEKEKKLMREREGGKKEESERERSGIRKRFVWAIRLRRWSLVEREREKERTEREVFINWKANWPRSE